MNPKARRKFAKSGIPDLVIGNEDISRKQYGFVSIIFIATALCWSLFQLWVASPLPYMDFFSQTLNLPIISGNSVRFVHLSFALFLAFLTYPFIQKSTRTRVPLIDWLFAGGAVFCIMALYFQADALAVRSGMPSQFDVIIAICGVVILLEATRRVLGLSLVIISLIFLVYAYFGHGWLIPDIIATKGHSLESLASNQWLGTEGVFGISIGVSAEFVFLFVLFGALLEKAGAGNYFIQLAFSLLGHMRGGPAKAAILSSALTGMIAGSSIANVVTTGTFTIPMMRRVGYSREQAGAIEVASGIDGQLMPPVMGTAAFLIAEYIGIGYAEVVKAAFIPAILSYMSLLYIVHLEAIKADMKVLPPKYPRTFLYKILAFAITISSFFILAGIIYYGVSWIKDVTGDYSTYYITAILVISYIGLLRYSSRFPALKMDDPNEEALTLPETAATFKTGTHYLLPLVVLVWCLMVEELSPGTSVFWTICFITFILITQKPIIAFFKDGKEAQIRNALKSGCSDFISALITGARNMTGVAIATASAGIIVGAIALTGVGQNITELVEYISGGSFFLILVFTAFFCLILGAGLPTTATYIVVATLLAPVIQELGAQNGMDIPLVAIHLFVFYFGLMADVTPPVGLAAFAAAAISGGDPMKTSWQGTIYSMRTAILPFIFIYSTELLLIGVDSVAESIWVFIKGTIAALLFAAATQGYFLVRCKIQDTVLLLIIVFTMFCPTQIIHLITPPYSEGDIHNIEKIIEESEVGSVLKFKVSGMNDFGDEKEFTGRIRIMEGENAKERLKKFGLTLMKDEDQVMVDMVTLYSDAQKAGFNMDDVLLEAEIPNEQANPNWIVLIGLGLLGYVIYSQNRRRTLVWQV